jgi:predicted CXXCH cytochrome family protein
MIRTIYVSFALILLIFSFSYSSCDIQLREKKEINVDNNTLEYLNHHDSVKYVGKESCVPCHSDKYNTFMETGMGRSFGEANVIKSAAKNHFPGYIYDTIRDLNYHIYFKDSSLYVKEFRIFALDTVFERTEKIDYIVGSGHHTNSHLMIRNGFLYQMPATFYTQKKVWDLPPGFKENNTRFARNIEAECMTCHNAMPKMDPNAFGKFDKIEHGIDCERCHGPGELHVQKMLKGDFVDNSKQKIDSTIVNPSKLTWIRQVDVCQRCHLQGNAVLKPNKTFSDFRPGMVLSDVFEVFMPEYKSESLFKMAAHAERFQESKCFIETNKKSSSIGKDFTCISCHNPHISVRNTNIAVFNQTCISCHSEAKQTKCSENKHTLVKNENNCVSCHMPQTGSTDIPHVSVHDHKIQKRKLNTDSIPSNPIGLKSINSKTTDNLTLFLAYISYYEKFEANEVYIRNAKELYPKIGNSRNELSAKIYFLYTINQTSEIINLIRKNENLDFDAWTCYRIGRAFYLGNNLNNAESWFSKAVLKKGKFTPFLISLADIYLKMELWNKAEVYIKQAQQLEPLNEIVLEKYLELYIAQNNIRNVVRMAQYILQYHPDNILAISVLVERNRNIGNNDSKSKYLESRLEKLKALKPSIKT